MSGGHLPDFDRTRDDPIILWGEEPTTAAPTTEPATEPPLTELPADPASGVPGVRINGGVTYRPGTGLLIARFWAELENGVTATVPMQAPDCVMEIFNEDGDSDSRIGRFDVLPEAVWFMFSLDLPAANYIARVTLADVNGRVYGPRTIGMAVH